MFGSKLIVNGFGSTMSNVANVVHAEASVTVTEYVPAAKPLTLVTPTSPVDQVIVNGAVPFAIIRFADPSVSPLHEMSFAFT